MKPILLALLLSVSAQPLLARRAPPQGSPDQPYVMEYYYKVQWGHQQEFLQLFLKNHYPLLKKIVESGRVASVRIELPANHATGEYLPTLGKSPLRNLTGPLGSPRDRYRPVEIAQCP